MVSTYIANNATICGCPVPRISRRPPTSLPIYINGGRFPYYPRYLILPPPGIAVHLAADIIIYPSIRYLVCTYLFLIFPTRHNTRPALLQLLLEILVHRERHCLAGRHPHDAGRDALVECVETFLSVFFLKKKKRKNGLALMVQ